MKEWAIAFPLHPEYRTLPMVWYVPAMSPKKEELAKKEQNPDADTDEMDYFAKVDEMRIPAQYFANLLTAGDVQPIREALAKACRPARVHAAEDRRWTGTTRCA